MDKKILKEILAAHADQLVNGQAASADYLKSLPENDDELAPLLDVAQLVESTLKPVSPPHEFEEELKRQLLTTAHLRQIEGYEPPHPFRDLLALLSALAFVFSLTGLLIVIQRRLSAQQSYAIE